MTGTVVASSIRSARVSLPPRSTSRTSLPVKDMGQDDSGNSLMCAGAGGPGADAYSEGAGQPLPTA